MVSVNYECSHHMRNFLQELPKCEHHVHIEGTLEPDLLFPLAKRNNITLPDSFPATVEALEKRYNEFTCLEDFLGFYYIGMSVLIKEQDFTDLAYAYFLKAKRDGVHHAEVFFDPQGHTERGIAIETVVTGFKKACDKAELELGITTKLIMCLLRHLPVKDSLVTIDDSLPYYKKGWIHGLGLDSSETPNPAIKFEECYSKMKALHPEVRLTAHAGEEGGPDFVSDALKYLNVTRIDHGVNSIKDLELIKQLAANNTMLTVCPVSNVKLQVVERVDQLPIAKFIEHGVPFSINSDDPAYFGAYILDNYIAVQESFGFDLKTWCKISQNGINGSWCSDERKKEMLDGVDLVYAKYKDLI